MIGFLWRLLWAWRAWRAVNRDGRATRLLSRARNLHANRWVPGSERAAGRLALGLGGAGALTQAWVDAEAVMPLGWRLMALVRQDDTHDWLATAAGPQDGHTLHGRGIEPELALRSLADELQRLRPS